MISRARQGSSLYFPKKPTPGMMALMHSLSFNTQGIWKPLQAGDSVFVVAPARQGKQDELALVRDFLEQWGLKAHIPEDLIGEDLLCANSDASRLKHLIEALNSPESAAVWCLRGGYGCTRLMPELLSLKPSTPPKWFIGFSDITALHLWLNDQWHWPTLHGPGIRQLAAHEMSERTFDLVKGVLFGERPLLLYPELLALNSSAHELKQLQAPLSGGNLSLIQSSIGTPWQFEAQNKIVLLEEISEAPYRVDRSLNHLLQAKRFEGVSAIILGDFTDDHSPEEKKIDEVLQRFADSMACPVYRLRGVGHGQQNLPMPLGVMAEIKPCLPS